MLETDIICLQDGRECVASKSARKCSEYRKFGACVAIYVIL